MSGINHTNKDKLIKFSKEEKELIAINFSDTFPCCKQGALKGLFGGIIGASVAGMLTSNGQRIIAVGFGTYAVSAFVLGAYCFQHHLRTELVKRKMVPIIVDLQEDLKAGLEVKIPDFLDKAADSTYENYVNVDK